jgi:hypothetical protein
VDALAPRSRLRTWLAAKSFGEPSAGCDPEMSEWGNPSRVMSGDPPAESIGGEEVSRGTETSQYPEERKSTRLR